MDKTLSVQLQIRQNAEEISSAIKDIRGWERSARDKDAALQSRATKPGGARDRVRKAGGTVPIRSSSAPSTAPPAGSTDLTPASMVDSVIAALPKPAGAAAVPAALGKYEERDVEEVERERGNAEFKVGNFHAAVKCYTKCLGLKGKNYVAFSNRAMAYIKLKEFARAVVDCNCALSIEPTHVKSLLRRAAAYSALGRLRAAVRDLLRAVDLEPSNKQARTDLVQAREQLRNAATRAPMVAVRNFSAFGAQRAPAEDGQQIEDLAIEQGPDPCPQPVLSVEERSSPLAAEAQEQERVEELQEEEEEEEVEIPIRRLVTLPSQAEGSTGSLPATTEPAVERPRRPAATGKKAATSRTGKMSRISGAYELEKALLRTQHDLEGQRAVLDSVEASLATTLGEATEPEALKLLLQAVLKVHHADASAATRWCEKICQLPRFAWLFSLLSKEDANRIADGLRAVLETPSEVLCAAYQLR